MKKVFLFLTLMTCLFFGGTSLVASAHTTCHCEKCESEAASTENEECSCCCHCEEHNHEVKIGSEDENFGKILTIFVAVVGIVLIIKAIIFD